MELFDKSQFSAKKDLHAFLVKNKNSLIAQKKAEIKKADCVSFATTIIRDKERGEKANEPIDTTNLTKITVVPIINTTNLFDNHEDVHVPGLWKKSLKENKMIMHLQEHAMKFDKIISDGSNLKAMTKEYPWSELNAPFEGKTEALVFESTIERKRNEFMFNQYASAYVKNHSVGMRYVQVVFAVNNDNYGAEFEAWEKYFPIIANKEAAEENSYFWAVKEAKIIEGSAVPLGSNWITPTLDNNSKGEPSKDTSKNHTEPSKDTQKRKYLLNLLNV